jgi:hypothetical protein
VTDCAVSRGWMCKGVPTNEHSTIQGRQVLGNRPVNTNDSNGCATVGRPLLRSAWMDTPDNNTWDVFLSSDVFSVGVPCQAYVGSSEDCSTWFDRKTLEIVQQLRRVQGTWETCDFYTVQEKIIRLEKITDWQTESHSRVPEAIKEN